MSRKTDPTTRINELADILKLSHKKPAEEETPPSAAPTASAGDRHPVIPERSSTTSQPPSASKAKAAPSPEEQVIPPSPAPGRLKNGKSSDKLNFVYKGLYLRKDTEKKAKRRLEDLETGQDFSELVEELLARWLKETS